MITVRIDEKHSSPEAAAQAALFIKQGGVVIFPTETVYGVAADALNEEAVRRVYEAKKRPLSQPLPVMVASGELINTVAIEIPDTARRLVDRFFPGPLTLVLKRSEQLPDIVTAGGETIGVRIPDHRVALDMLAAVGGPIVATSANIHGGAEPKTAEEAVLQIGGSVDCVVDAGEVRIGVASTIIDVTVTPPRILRVGALSKEMIEQEIGEVAN